MMYLGDYAEDATIDFNWSTNDAGGASITRATDGTISVYKANGTTQSVAGITDTEDFDSLTGIHHCRIDTSADAFYATANDYAVVLSAATIDGETVNAVIAHFSIENRYAGSAGLGAIISVEPIIPTSIGLADTKTYQLGLMLTDAIDDLPSTAEITPGTISIDRSAPGATSWTSVVSDAACSEIAGLVYYDEVFDDGTGYAEGDSIRITFKSVKVTVGGNDYEIIGATGRIFYTTVNTNSLTLSKLALITTGAVNIVSGPDEDGYIKLFKGGSRTTAMGNQLDFDLDGTTYDASGQDVYLRLIEGSNAVGGGGAGTVKCVTGSVVNGGLASQVLRFEVTAAASTNYATDHANQATYPKQDRYYAYSYQVVVDSGTEEDVFFTGYASVTALAECP